MKDKTGKTAFDTLLEMAPEDKKSRLEEIFRKNESLQDEDDPMFQVIIALCVFESFLQEIPNKMKEASEESRKGREKVASAIIEAGKINFGFTGKLKAIIAVVIVALFAQAIFIFQTNSILNRIDEQQNATVYLIKELNTIKKGLHTSEQKKENLDSEMKTLNEFKEWYDNYFEDKR